MAVRNTTVRPIVLRFSASPDVLVCDASLLEPDYDLPHGLGVDAALGEVEHHAEGAEAFATQVKAAQASAAKKKSN